MVKCEVVFDGNNAFVNGFKIQPDTATYGNTTIGYESELFFRVQRIYIESLFTCEHIFKTQIEAVLFCLENGNVNI